MGNGNRCCSSVMPARIHLAALLRIGQFSVHAVTMSVIVNVRANSPTSVGPQCATVSASITPGLSGASSVQVRIVIELRSSGDGFVVETPLTRILSRAGLRYCRSTVAALIAPSCVIASSVANGRSRSPEAANSGSHSSSITTRYLPHGMPINAHTCSSSAPGVVAEASRPSVRARDLLGPLRQPGTGQHPPRRPAAHPGGIDHQIQDLPPVRLARPAVPTSQLVGDLPSRRHVDLAFHTRQAFPGTRSKQLRHAADAPTGRLAALR